MHKIVSWPSREITEQDGEVGGDWLCRPESASVVAKEVVRDWYYFFPGCKVDIEHFLNMETEPRVFSSAETLSLDVSARRIGKPARYDDSLALSNCMGST